MMISRKGAKAQSSNLWKSSRRIFPMIGSLHVDPLGIYSPAAVGAALGIKASKARKAFGARKLPGNVWVIAGSELLKAAGAALPQAPVSRARASRALPVREDVQAMSEDTGGSSSLTDGRGRRLPRARKLHETSGAIQRSV